MAEGGPPRKVHADSEGTGPKGSDGTRRFNVSLRM